MPSIETIIAELDENDPLVVAYEEWIRAQNTELDNIKGPSAPFDIHVLAKEAEIKLANELRKRDLGC